jgi:hypothetical protein
MPDLMTYMTQTGLLDEAELQDPEYDEYCKRVDDPGTYKEWQSMAAEWEYLNGCYKRECEPAFFQSAADPLPSVVRRAKELLKAMTDLECLLGY